MKNANAIAVTGALKRLAIEKQRPLWKRVAVDLEKSTRQRRIVNLWHLEQHANAGEILLVPGKVLGDGELTKKVTVAASSFSASAREKLAANGSTVLSIEELMKKQPDGKNVRIIG